MFGARYFGARYFGPKYFGSGGTGSVVAVPISRRRGRVTFRGGYVSTDAIPDVVTAAPPEPTEAHVSGRGGMVLFGTATVMSDTKTRARQTDEALLLLMDL
jgi:hypothetical protein